MVRSVHQATLSSLAVAFVVPQALLPSAGRVGSIPRWWAFLHGSVAAIGEPFSRLLIREAFDGLSGAISFHC